jgi:glycosyltransferase involved in cell wall biosynthesis
MWIGYLQLGPPEHGICRYGKLLAAEGHRRSQVNFKITEVNINLTKNSKDNREMLINAARQLSVAEIIHVQYSYKNNRSLWGTRWEQLYHLLLFKYHCSRPIVVTIHDIYEPPLSINTVLTQVYQKFQNLTSPINKDNSPTSEELSVSKLPLSKVIQRSIFGANALAFRWLLNQAKLVFVCSYEEDQRLKAIANINKIQIIPHFVEKQATTTSQAEAKTKLKLDGDTVITILGFIHSRKGYKLMVETMPKLPQEVKVVFAGGPSPGNEEFVQELMQLAKERGVGDRLRITGYLSEEELEQYLVATDLAVCPFKSFSASGSLSNWLSVACPILAYDLPQIAEYNLLEPGAIKTFQQYNPETFAEAIKQLLLTTSQNDDPVVVRLIPRDNSF